MENSQTDVLRSRQSPIKEEKATTLNHRKMGKNNTMLAITLFFTLFTVATFSGLILWQKNLAKQEENTRVPLEKDHQPDTIVTAR